MPSTRSHAEPGTLEMNGRFVLFGGRMNAFPVHNDVVEFNPATKSWESLGKLPDGKWINPSVGFFKNATRFGDKNSSDWVVMTAGGRQYDDARADLFIAEVSFDCNDTRHSPAYPQWWVPKASAPSDQTPPKPPTFREGVPVSDLPVGTPLRAPAAPSPFSPPSGAPSLRPLACFLICVLFCSKILECEV